MKGKIMTQKLWPENLVRILTDISCRRISKEYREALDSDQVDLLVELFSVELDYAQGNLTNYEYNDLVKPILERTYDAF